MKYSLLVLVFTLSACVSYPTREEDKSIGNKKSAVADYFKDRVMDFRDIITVTGSFGLLGGAKVQVGPVGVGLYAEDGGGLGHSGIPLAVEGGLRNGEAGEHRTRELIFVVNKTSSNPGDSDKLLRAGDRCKSYENSFDNLSSYTRIGVGGGLLLGAKLEVNPGELLDFILGIFLIDIYRDDIYLKEKKKCNW